MGKIALAYPKIPGSHNAPLSRCVAFEKYDGTNLHWVWDCELGWYAFGTRRDRFDLDESGIEDFCKRHPMLGEAADLFLRTLAEELTTKVQVNYRQARELVAFTEFLGDESFAGAHKQHDPKRLVLIDVSVDARMLPPEEFLDLPEGLPLARVVYQGKLTGRFAEDVRCGRYPVEEGVVCKGEVDGCVWMAKIKTNAYMEKLKKQFSDKWKDYWE